MAYSFGDDIVFGFNSMGYSPLILSCVSQSSCRCQANITSGGTAAAAKKLVEQCGGEFLGYLFLIEIAVLRGHEQRKHLGDKPLLALVED